MTDTLKGTVVLFDLDGTLVDTLNLIVTSYQETFRRVLKRELDEAEVRAWIGRPLLEAMYDVEPDHVDELHDTYLKINDRRTEELIKPFIGADVALRSLIEQGTRLGVVTSKRRSAAQLALQFTGLDGLIGLTIALEDTSGHKPSPEPLLRAAKVLNVDPSDCTYVGDAVVDIQAAKAAGMRAVAVTWGAGTREALASSTPDALVNDWDELIDVLS